VVPKVAGSSPVFHPCRKCRVLPAGTPPSVTTGRFPGRLELCVVRQNCIRPHALFTGPLFTGPLFTGPSFTGPSFTGAPPRFLCQGVFRIPTAQTGIELQLPPVGCWNRCQASGLKLMASLEAFAFNVAGEFFIREADARRPAFASREVATFRVAMAAVPGQSCTR